jgi:two-component system response regulator HydG
MSESRARVLVVDDQAQMAEMVADGLADRGYDAVAVSSCKEAKKRLEGERVDALVTDLRMPDGDGLELLEASMKLAAERPVIVMTAYSAVDTAVESIRRGAYHYLTKPFKVDELALFLGRALDASKLRREAAAMRRALAEKRGASNVLGQSKAMVELRDLIERVAQSSAPVLVTGETGTGKGLVARAIHAQGARAAAPFVSVSCAAVPEALLESELFGHKKGAFTGATQNRVGLIEEANGGTLFLDEIGEMAPALQAKLLTVLESGTVRPVGANRETTVDVRFIAATHRDLRARVAEGAFREDLLYRLEVVTLEIPSLRHRREDIPLLLEHFLSLAKEKNPHSPVARFSRDALARLLEHAWPGNVRELSHVTERLVLLGRNEEIGVADLPATITEKHTQKFAFKGEVLPMREVQRLYAAWAYEELGAKKLLTAEKLDVDPKTLAKWLDEHPSRPPKD